MKTVNIRGIDYNDIKEVHEYLAAELEFPSYYGKNLSALYDVLTDICEDTTVVMDLREMQDEDLSEKLHRMCTVLRDAAEYNKSLTVEIL